MFLLQIVYPNGEVVQLPAGGRLEMALVDEIVAGAKDRGIGFLKTEAQVERALREGIAQALYNFKVQTRAIG